MQSQENTNVPTKILPIYIKNKIDNFEFCKKIKPLTNPEGLNKYPKDVNSPAHALFAMGPTQHLTKDVPNLKIFKKFEY
jgi:hypothetical protein